MLTFKDTFEAQLIAVGYGSTGRHVSAYGSEPLAPELRRVFHDVRQGVVNANELRIEEPR